MTRKNKEKLGRTYEQKRQYNRGRGRNEKRQEGCFRCGSYGHWVRDFPEPESQEDKEEWVLTRESSDCDKPTQEESKEEAVGKGTTD